ncbi:ABC transporter ATP-binding protein [Sporosarcina sp. Marseille-Q4063]|uniref:ABC transporter ATP-binding protein n=1 Tax=Sporosarcina sp. Marseille-Q4063 TaxID=2810514 RepID=UPI001BAF1593|nr:ABC transporter ATP-binding protein [Sporosarcina sp. Marseille-Q4063]QUW23333.1 ABC transporter ATP-binding protein [Sporosarcina sp. Marseille-Q4063]
MLHINNIEVVYSKNILALKGMSLHVPEGKIVALLGSNGAGKSTTLKAISGLLVGEDGQVTDGTIEYQGKQINNTTPDVIVKNGIFQSMEGRRVFKNLTVEENLIAGAYTRKDRKQLKDDVEKIYVYFPKLKALQHRKSGFLSGGEQQMLAIGRGIMAKPKLLLLDEPSLGIAPLLVEEIFQNIKQINKEEGTSILVVEQNANVALSISDYGYIMENGRVAMQGDVDMLLSNEEVREHYLGIGKEGEKSYKENKVYRRRKRVVW